ncbi:ATP-dependent DNA ligase [Kordia sp. YSTF-M3]|uniref:ATP-dependent DNA ligase n=1 Tax=Kordia aestuariivivens TaxID=2759037 RepID=A0ABR7QBI8_9FLAO|nr:non-homologous end-joining DNA ligase [Kordia aestuariivivens]MBC8755883.1 ATP-dependent DNA ligase [Kordia aestuariivivens]
MKANISKIKITGKNKILFPESGITKNDLILYYNRITNYILPYLKNRPITMQRFPGGISEKGFFQKHVPDYFPDWITTARIEKVGGWVEHVVCNTKETLLYLVSQGVITFHSPLSTLDHIKFPDKLVFDLDPPKENFKLAIKAAKALHHLLEEELQLKTFVMTSGSKGLHVVTPLLQKDNFDEVHDFAKNISQYICNKYPNDFTTAIRKNKREGKLYVDFLRNSYAQTSVSPFSVRAIENAPVATPISWNELDDKNLNPQLYTIKNIFNRLEKVEDPWKEFTLNAKSIDAAKLKLVTLITN